jgi:predicted peptidase
MINPGDQIRGIVYATGRTEDWDRDLQAYCDIEADADAGSAATFSCDASAGDRVFIGNCLGVTGKSRWALNRAWNSLDAQMTFDRMPVNLPAFGVLDGLGAEEGTRVANVVVDGISEGVHTVVCSYESGDEIRTATFEFTVTAASESFPTLSEGQASGLQPHTSMTTDLSFLLYLPSLDGGVPERALPLLVYLHDEDQVHGGLAVLEGAYLLSRLKEQSDFPFVVLAPKGKGEGDLWADEAMMADVMALMAEVQASAPVDPNRIYLTGVGLGGNGTWALGLRQPSRFAALAPVMGVYGQPPEVPGEICSLIDVPVWAFHGEQDDVVPVAVGQRLVSALTQCGGSPRFTTFPDAGHTLGGEEIYTSELYNWLLSHTRR